MDEEIDKKNRDGEELKEEKLGKEEELGKEVEEKNLSETKESDKKNDTEKISETFEITKEGEKEKEVVTHGELKKEHSSKKDARRYNKILWGVLIVFGLVIAAFFFWLMFLNSLQTTEYEGVQFKVVHQGNIIFYNNVVPIYREGNHVADYNFYLRKNPPRTGKIPFEGELMYNNLVVINMTEKLNCEGDGLIALANMVKPFEMMGATILNDPNATCDSENRYLYLNIIQSDKNKITQLDESCYQLEVKECDILDVTERFMLEMFVQMEEDLKQNTF